MLSNLMRHTSEPELRIGSWFALGSPTTLTVILATITLPFDKVDVEVDMVTYIRPSGRVEIITPVIT